MKSLKFRHIFLCIGAFLLLRVSLLIIKARKSLQLEGANANDFDLSYLMIGEVLFGVLFCLMGIILLTSNYKPVRITELNRKSLDDSHIRANFQSLYTRGRILTQTMKKLLVPPPTI